MGGLIRSAWCAAKRIPLLTHSTSSPSDRDSNRNSKTKWIAFLISNENFKWKTSTGICLHKASSNASAGAFLSGGNFEWHTLPVSSGLPWKFCDETFWTSESEMTSRGVLLEILNFKIWRLEWPRNTSRHKSLPQPVSLQRNPEKVFSENSLLTPTSLWRPAKRDSPLENFECLLKAQRGRLKDPTQEGLKRIFWKDPGKIERRSLIEFL